MHPGYITVGGERREITDPMITVGGERKAVLEGYIAVGGERRQWFSRGVAYIFGTTGNQSDVSVYAVKVSGNSAAYNLAGSFEMPENQHGQKYYRPLSAYRDSDDSILLGVWKPDTGAGTENDSTAGIQRLTLDDDGVPTLGQLYTSSFTGAMVGMYSIGGTLYGVQPNANTQSILFGASIFTTTATAQASPTGNTGGISQFETGDIYAVGNYAVTGGMSVSVARINSLASITELTNDSETFLIDGGVEAAFAVNASRIAVFETGGSNRMIFVDISGDNYTLSAAGGTPPTADAWAAVPMTGG